MIAMILYLNIGIHLEGVVLAESHRTVTRCFLPIPIPLDTETIGGIIHLGVDLDRLLLPVMIQDLVHVHLAVPIADSVTDLTPTQHRDCFTEAADSLDAIEDHLIRWRGRI